MADTQRGRILVVDDDPLVRWFFERALRKAGYSVDTAPGVSEAIGILGRERVEVLVTDMRMPGENGALLVDRLRNMPEPPVVIVCSAFVSEEVNQQLTEKGVFRVMTKPLRIEELLSSVREAMAQV